MAELAHSDICQHGQKKISTALDDVSDPEQFGETISVADGICRLYKKQWMGEQHT